MARVYRRQALSNPLFLFSLDVKTPAQRCLGTEKPRQKEKDPMGRDEMGDTPGSSAEGKSQLCITPTGLHLVWLLMHR